MSTRVVADPLLAVAPDRAGKLPFLRPPSKWAAQLLAYLWGALAALASTESALIARRYLQLADIIMLHLIGVVVIATRFDRTVSVFTAVVSVLMFDFVFVPPEFVLSMPDVRSAITCAGMLAVAVVISGLTTRARRLELAAGVREARTALLYEFCRELVEATGADALVAVAVRRFQEILGRRVALLVPTPGGALTVADVLGPIWLSDAELERAAEVWRRGAKSWHRGQPARTHTSSRGQVTHFLFVTGASAPLGLLVVRGPPALFADAAEREFFRVCTHQAALAIERADLAEKAASAELAARRQHVHNALLRSISHDFRTPLAAIVGAGMSLADFGAALAPDARAVLERTIVDQGQRLHRLLTNVLSATRLDGELRLERTPCSLDEIVESALRHLGETASKRAVEVTLPFELPLIDVDPVLFEQLVVNVVENGIRYSPNGTIEISARSEENLVLLSVSDCGPGVAPGDEEKVFEKFYRGSFAGQTDGGMGLGLTICHAIAQAHGGRITARNRPGGGLCVTTALPRAAPRACPNSPSPSLPDNAA